MKMLVSGLAAAALAAGALAAPAQAADAAAGAKTFGMRCVMCHGKDAAGTNLAPSLKGVVGRKAASTAFPRYSPALKSSKITWTPDKLTTFLAGPQKMVPGTQMMVMLPKADDRANVVAFLATQK